MRSTAFASRCPSASCAAPGPDILIDGSLDFPDSILECFDVVIASIHARHRLDRQRMTERLARAVAAAARDLGPRARPHPRAASPDRLRRARRARRARELARRHRAEQRPPPARSACWLPAARDGNIPCVISVDAHSTRGLGMLRSGVQLARRGGVLRREVLNTRTPEAFAVLVKPA